MINCICKEDQACYQVKCANPATLAIEFECGDCCKKVLLFKDGKTELDLDENTGLLCANDNLQLFLKVFNNGEVVEKQVMKKIFVKKMCSVNLA